MTPYRAKLSGIVTELHVPTSICQGNKLSTGFINMYCDCEKAVKNITVTSSKGIADYLESDSDLLNEARLLYKNCPVSLNLQWVEGHSSGNNLTIAQTLNQQAHTLAYNYLKNPDPAFSPSCKVINPPSQIVSISFTDSNLTSKVARTIHNQLHNKPIIDTICKNSQLR
jgi:hypothetical protein